MAATRRGFGGFPASSPSGALPLAALLLLGGSPAASLAASDPAPATTPAWMAPDTSDVTADPTLEGKVIREIHISSRNIFDPLPTGALRPIGHVANKLHVRTRQQTVRDQFILRPGEAWTADRGR